MPRGYVGEVKLELQLSQETGRTFFRIVGPLGGVRWEQSLSENQFQHLWKQVEAVAAQRERRRGAVM
jgi:hypothetical protein